jgi:hypothetical protein
MNYKNYTINHILPPRKPFSMKNISRYADLILISGTGILLSLTILTSIYYFKELNNQVFERSFITSDELTNSIIELIIGKSLVVLDFVYVVIYQISGILACRFKISYILFLSYIQLCKIILSPYVPKNLTSANILLQAILATQMFLIILNFDLKKSHNQQADQTDGLIINI